MASPLLAAPHRLHEELENAQALESDLGSNSSSSPVTWGKVLKTPEPMFPRVRMSARDSAYLTRLSCGFGPITPVDFVA